jgi:hypothetical protein
MKKLILTFLAVGSFCPVCFPESPFMKEMGDAGEMRQLKSGMEDISTQVRVAGEQRRSPSSLGMIFEVYMKNADRWEDEFPYEFPKEPTLSKQSGQKAYALNIAMIEDHAGRLDRYDARMKEKTHQSANDAARCYPQFVKEEEALYAKYWEVFKALVEEKSPIIKNPDAIFIVVSMSAKMLGIKPVEPR